MTTPSQEAREAALLEVTEYSSGPLSKEPGTHVQSLLNSAVAGVMEVSRLATEAELAEKDEEIARLQATAQDLDKRRRELEDNQRIIDNEHQAELAQLREERDRWKDGRRQGREEMLSILLRYDAEDFPNDFQGSAPLADTGDYVTHWKESELKKLFKVSESNALVEQLDGAFWKMASEVQELQFERDALRTRAEAAEKERDEARNMFTTLQRRAGELIENDFKNAIRNRALLADNLALRDALIEFKNASDNFDQAKAFYTVYRNETSVQIAMDNATLRLANAQEVVGRIIDSPSPGQPMLDAVEKINDTIEKYRAVEIDGGEALFRIADALAQYRKQK